MRVRAIDPPGPTLTLPGDTGRLYGLDSTEADPGGVLHVAEGETDREAWSRPGRWPRSPFQGAPALHGAALAM